VKRVWGDGVVEKDPYECPGVRSYVWWVSSEVLWKGKDEARGSGVGEEVCGSV
jgi:hypothetical protein